MMRPKKTRPPSHTTLRTELDRIATSLEQLTKLALTSNDTLCELLSAAKSNLNPQPGPCSAPRSNRSESTSQPSTFDLAKEDVISFRQAKEFISTHPGISTISRWCTSGVRKVRLESILIGGRRKTTRQAVDRFLVKCSERDFVGFTGDISQLRKHVESIKSRAKKPGK
jgi:hypothetical protein